MNESRHDTWVELILAYEDLSAEERTRADLHLATCEGCRLMLSRLQAAERTAAQSGALPSLHDRAAYEMSASEEQQARASLAALREQLGVPALAPPAPPTAEVLAPRRSGWRRWMTWTLVPAAAAAVVAVLLLVLGPGEVGMCPGDLQLVAVSGLRAGETLAGRATVPVDGVMLPVWHTGEAFRLRFALAAPGYPVIVHVDPAGRAALLYPVEASEPPARFPAGASIEVPTRPSEGEWMFEGQTGPETFLVAVQETNPGWADLAAALESLSPTAGGRAAVVDEARAWLKRRVGPVSEIAVMHAE